MDEALTRTAASDAVEAIGWRYLLGAYSTSVPVDGHGRVDMGSFVSTCRTEGSPGGVVGVLQALDARPCRVTVLAALVAPDQALASQLA